MTRERTIGLRAVKKNSRTEDDDTLRKVPPLDTTAGITLRAAYNEFGYYERLSITSKFFSQKVRLQHVLLITNIFFNELSCSL